MLLDNVPEFLFWLGGAALAGATVVGINPTRRGPELENDIAHTDCQLIVTDAAGAALLDGLDIGVARDRILDVESTAYKDSLADHAGATVPDITSDRPVDPAAAARSRPERRAHPRPCAARRAGWRRSPTNVETQYGVCRDDVCYSPHAALPRQRADGPVGAVGARRRDHRSDPQVLGQRFPFATSVDYGATYFTYVGKALTYVLATPEQADDADNPLRLGFGNEASDRDIERFQARFGCRIVEGYGSSEGGAVIVRVPDMPAGSLGVGAPGVAVVDPESMEECPPARFDEQGRLLNAEEATGEIVNKLGVERFEGYYRNEQAGAERTRNGWYWSGDLAYRDDRGFFWFAGRSADWLRVDGENFSAAPVERILHRFDGVVMVAVFAVPDALSGDQALAVLELAGGIESFDPAAFAAFLDAQPDLGTKWAPRFVRITESMPLTSSNKVVKRDLRSEAWITNEPVYWRAARGDNLYRLMDGDDRVALHAEFDAHGRSGLIPAPATTAPKEN